jgi:hypothetical protein
VDQTTPKVGKLLDSSSGRDAIHFALAPVIATCELVPGQDIGVWNGVRAHPGEPFVGIADPFLKENPRKGDRFWCFLYPGSITNLRHIWQHPAFTIKVPEVPTNES